MYSQAVFGLLLNKEQIVPKDLEDNKTARFTFNFDGFTPLSCEGHDGPLNYFFLEVQLKQMVPVDKRQLTIKFKLHTKSHAGGTLFNELLQSVDIFVEGELLKGLHSAMSCTKEEKIGLMLKADLAGIGAEEVTAQPLRRTTKTFSTDGYDYVELSPELTDGERDYGKYACFNLKLNLHKRPVSFGSVLASWKVSNLDLIIKGCTSCDHLDHSHALQLNKRLLMEGLGVDVEILAKDRAVIPCHGSILIAQSPVIGRMLEDGHFVEGSNRKINLLEWSQAEVIAFLSHLYYGGGADAAMRDVSMNMALFKMGDYYEIKTLKDKMKKIMLQRSAQKISVENAFALFELGKLSNESDLAGKGVEALIWRSDEVLQQSELFRKIFPTESGREMVRSLLSMVRLKEGGKGED